MANDVSEIFAMGVRPARGSARENLWQFFQTLNRKLFFRFLYLKKPLESKPHRFSPDHFFV
jgi:hypothetical protein